MNAMHLDQREINVSTQRLGVVRCDTLFENMLIPGTVPIFTAQDELDARVEQLQGFGPLEGLLGVVLFGLLSDLPGPPDFVAESPVFDLCQRTSVWLDHTADIAVCTNVVWLLVSVLPTEIGVVRVVLGIAVLKPSESCLLSAITVETSIDLDHFQPTFVQCAYACR